MAGNREDSRKPEFWDVRYAAGRTPWELPGVPAALTRFLQDAAPGLALVPGCGAGHEVRAFHDAGWRVTAVDFSPVAVRRAHSLLGELSRHVILGDFFTHDFGAEKFDVVYERTFLCALPPDRWAAYAARMEQLLPPEGRLVGVFLYGEELEPPPYPLQASIAEDLFAARFRLDTSVAVDDSLPLFAGKERWQEWVRRSDRAPS